MELSITTLVVGQSVLGIQALALGVEMENVVDQVIHLQEIAQMLKLNYQLVNIDVWLLKRVVIKQSPSKGTL
jgi:hypothetical protein